MTRMLATRNLAPWAGFRELEDQLERVFSGRAPAACARDGWTPAVDLRETEEAYVLEADLPGLKKEDIAVTVVDDVVTLKGARKWEHEGKAKGYQRVERSYGAFERSFRIADGIDAGKVEAQFQDGVLNVTLPKPEEAKPKQIEVKLS